MIVALRVLLMAIAAAALAAAISVGLHGPGGQVTSVRYACPMHPEVRGAGPGACPICRMVLEPIGRPAGAGARVSAQETADLAAVENVRKHNIVDFVRKRSLLVPARELRGPASVDADGLLTALFYDDEIEALDADEAGVFIPSGAPGRAFAIRRARGLPVPWDGSTSQIRFRFDASGSDSSAGGAGTGAHGAGHPAGLGGGHPAPVVGWVELAPRPRQVLTVPASAVLPSPEGPYVLAWTGVGFNFEKRPIKIGETFLKQGFAVVLAGLRVNERVVSRATFFLEADRRATAQAVGTGWSSL